MGYYILFVKSRASQTLRYNHQACAQHDPRSNMLQFSAAGKGGTLQPKSRTQITSVCATIHRDCHFQLSMPGRRWMPFMSHWLDLVELRNGEAEDAPV